VTGEPIGVTAFQGVAFAGCGQQYVGASVVRVVDAVEEQAGSHHVGGGIVGHGTEQLVYQTGSPGTATGIRWV